MLSLRSCRGFFADLLLSQRRPSKRSDFGRLSLRWRFFVLRHAQDERNFATGERLGAPLLQHVAVEPLGVAAKQRPHFLEHLVLLRALRVLIVAVAGVPCDATPYLIGVVLARANHRRHPAALAEPALVLLRRHDSPEFVHLSRLDLHSPETDMLCRHRPTSFAKRAPCTDDRPR